MRARMTAIAAAACAMALLPTASAVAGTGPAPDNLRKGPQTSAPSAAGNPDSARAHAAGVCADAYVIGTTGYIYRNGQKIGSVKQFYSPDCQENYGYLWVWDSFRNTHSDYDVSVGVFSYDRDAVVGKRSWYDTNGQEFWSNPANTVSDCTSAVGTIRAQGDPLPGQAASSKRC